MDSLDLLVLLQSKVNFQHSPLPIDPRGSRSIRHTSNKFVKPVRAKLGMGSAVESLCGQAYGAHHYGMLGVYLQRATIVLTLTGLLVTTVYILSKPIFLLLGEPSDFASATAVFIYGLIPQIFVYTVNFPIQKFLQLQSIVAPSTYISAGTLGVHLFLSWVAAYKMVLGLLGISLV